VLTKFDLSQALYSSEAAADFQRQLLERVSQLRRCRRRHMRHHALKGDMPYTDVFSQQTVDFRPSNKAFTTCFLPFRLVTLRPLKQH